MYKAQITLLNRVEILQTNEIDQYLHFHLLWDFLPIAGVACVNGQSHGVTVGVEVHHKASLTFDGDSVHYFFLLYDLV